MTDESYDLLDADRPIPLGRPAASTAHRKGQPVDETPSAVPVSHKDVEPPHVLTAVVVEPDTVLATGSTKPVDPAIRPAPPPVSSRLPADASAQPDAHTPTGLGWFRLGRVRVHPGDRWRGALGPSLVRFVLAIAFVDVLILAFALLLAHFTGGGVTVNPTTQEMRFVNRIVSILLDVSLNPDPSKLPFTGTLQDLANGLLAVVLIVIAVAVFFSGGKWALGVATNNVGWAEQGKSGFIVGAIAAILAGGADVLVNAFFHIGKGLH